MKNTWLRLAATAAVAGGMLLAAQQVENQQAPAPAAQGRAQRGQRLASYLNLTPAQAAQARTDMKTARQASQPARQQLRELHASMAQAVRANDTAKINQLSAQEANLKGQIEATRQEAFAHIYSTLTPEQRAKADQLPAHMKQMRQQRMQNQQTPNNG